MVGKEMLECVVTDLDGSLLDGNRQMGLQDRQTISRLMEKGIPVLIATGRHQCVTREYVQLAGIQLPVITANGSVLYDFQQERPLWVRPLPVAAVAGLWRWCLEHRLRYYFYSDRKSYFYLNEENRPYFQEELRDMDREGPREFEIVSPDFDPTPYAVTKFMISGCIPAMLARLREQDFIRQYGLELAYSSANFLEVNADGVSKGNALREVAKRLGFSLENTLALGDYYNDLPMLQAVGIPVVPASCEEGMKAFGFYQTVPCGSNPLTAAVDHFFPHLIEDPKAPCLG